MNPEFEALIESLLYRYECVILPDFGGFIVRDSPCNFNADKSQIKPKSKHIFFNPHLTHNDGLLYNEIQKSKNISYQESIDFYKNVLSSYKKDLSNNAQAKFGNLGIFFQNNDTQIWFSPSQKLNLSQDTFGLSAFDIQSVQVNTKIENQEVSKTEILEPIDTEVQNTSTLIDNKPIESIPMHPKLSKKAWLIAASIALVSHFVYLGLESQFTSNNEIASVIPQINSNSIAPLDSDTLSSTENTPLEYIDADSSILPSPIDEPEYTEPNTVNTPESSFSAPSETISKENNSISAEQSPSNSEINSSTEEVKTELPAEQVQLEKQYSKVAKYKMEANALSHQSDLEKKGKICKTEHNGDWYEVFVEQ